MEGAVGQGLWCQWQGAAARTPTPLKNPIKRSLLTGGCLVQVGDIPFCLRPEIAVGLVTASPAQLAAGDLNGDGKIAINEVTQILRAAVGLVTL